MPASLQNFSENRSFRSDLGPPLEFHKSPSPYCLGELTMIQNRIAYFMRYPFHPCASARVEPMLPAKNGPFKLTEICDVDCAITLRC